MSKGLGYFAGQTGNCWTSMRYTKVSKAKLPDTPSPPDDFPPPGELDDGEEAGKYRDKGDSYHAH